ncbi:MAG: ArsR/SmtB family transcription factor [Polaromonas sp.]
MKITDTLNVLTNPPPLLDEAATVKALTALAQTQRLRAFRALVVAGADGLTPGVMAEQLGVAPSALSFHLKELAHSGLVSTEARGRNLIYRANFEQMNGLLAYLTAHCCMGQACDVAALPVCVDC